MFGKKKKKSQPTKQVHEQSRKKPGAKKIPKQPPQQSNLSMLEQFNLSQERIKKEFEEIENRYFKIKPEEMPNDIKKALLSLMDKTNVTEREIFILEKALMSMDEWYFIIMKDEKATIPYVAKVQEKLAVIAFLSEDSAKKEMETKPIFKNEGQINQIIPIPVRDVVTGTNPFLNLKIEVINIEGVYNIPLAGAVDTYFSCVNSYRLHRLNYGRAKGADNGQELFDEMLKLPCWFFIMENGRIHFLPSHGGALTELPVFATRLSVRHFIQKVLKKTNLQIVQVHHSKVVDFLKPQMLGGTASFRFVGIDHKNKVPVEFTISVKYFDKHVEKISKMNFEGPMFTRFGNKEEINKEEWGKCITLAKTLSNKGANALVFGNVFLLDSWHIIMRDFNMKTNNGRTYSVIHEGLPSLAVFTSVDLAKECLEGIPGKLEGELVTISSLKIPEQLDEMMKSKDEGIIKIIFNVHIEEPGGFYGPIHNLKEGYEWHLKNDPRFKKTE